MKFDFISKYFPPEKFLKPPHLGISFSDFNIKAVSFYKKIQKPSLVSAVVPLKTGYIVNGSITDMQGVVSVLSEIRKKFDSPFVFFTIPDELAYVFSASVAVARKDATENVAFIMEENVPLPLGDIVFDFVPTEIISIGPEHKASMVVAAGVKKEIEKFIEAFNQSGFEPVGCIHESQAIAKAVVPEGFVGNLGIVHARKNRLGIYMVKNSLVCFSTIRSILGDDYKKEFLDEYQKFLEYCNKSDIGQSQSIDPILFCGEFEYAKKTAEAVINFGNGVKNAKLANVWTNILNIEKNIPEVSYEESLNLAGPIGAVLSDII